MVEVLLKFASASEAHAALGALLNGGKSASAGGATTSRTAAGADGAVSGKASTAKLPKYEDTKLPELIKTLAKTNRDGVVATLKSFGVEKGADLKPEQYADAQAKLEELAKGGEDLS